MAVQALRCIVVDRFLPPNQRKDTLAKINYAFEKRQREIAKKKQKDQKQSKKQSGREGDKSADQSGKVMRG